MVIADTSVLIDLLRGSIKSKELQEYGEIETCFPIQCELYKGTQLARKTEKGQKEVEKLNQILHNLEANQESAKIFAKLQHEYKEINELDLMIASIAQAHNKKLLTNDRDFQEIKEIETLILD